MQNNLRKNPYLKIIAICVGICFLFTANTYAMHSLSNNKTTLRNNLMTDGSNVLRLENAKDAIEKREQYSDEYPFPTPPIVGDDVTGQLQLSEPFLKLGYPPVIPLEPFTILLKDKVVLVSLDTRTSSSEVTYNKTLQFMRSFKCDRNLIPFRMDSNYRGYWAKGLQAVIDETNPDIIFVAPALPDENRFTKDGKHFQISAKNGSKIDLNSLPEFAKDIYAPDGQKDDLSSILKYQLQRNDVEIVKLKSSMPEKEILNELGKCKKGAFVIFDVASPEELTKLSGFIAEYSKHNKVVAAGSSGLVKELIKQVYPPITPEIPPVQSLEDMKGRIKLSYEKKGALIIAGSITQGTINQINKAEEALGDDVEEVCLNVDHILSISKRENDIKYARSLVKEFLENGKHVILKTTSPAKIDRSPEQKIQIAQALAKVINEKGLLNNLALLTVVGGDTSRELMRELGAKNLLPIGEVEKLVPIVRLEGGILPDDVPVIIKAGNIGGDAILADIVRTFSEKRTAFLKENSVKMGITLGDPASGAPEMVARFFLEYQHSTLGSIPIVIGHRSFLERAIKVVRENNPKIGKNPLTIKVITKDDISDIKYEPHTIYLYEPEVSDLKEEEIILGTPNAMSGHVAIAYIKASAEFVEEGLIDGIVNAPISKEATDEALKIGLDNDWPGGGHSEAYEKYIGTEDGESTTMVMAGKRDAKKMFLLQHHETTWKAFQNLEKPEIVDKLLKVIRLANNTLKEQFGIDNPRICAPGPNPHSGSGELGIGKYDTEAEKNIRQAVKTAREEGIDVYGPKPQSEAFSELMKGNYDVVIALEHETGHIAGYLMAMIDETSYPVIYTITLGLAGNVVRSTVLHGSAEDKAGRGIVSADALNGAFTAAIKMAHNRKERMALPSYTTRTGV